MSVPLEFQQGGSQYQKPCVCHKIHANVARQRGLGSSYGREPRQCLTAHKWQLPPIEASETPPQNLPSEMTEAAMMETAVVLRV